MSDPLLLSGIILLIFGPILFLISAWKYFKTPSVDSHFKIPVEPVSPLVQAPVVKEEALPQIEKIEVADKESFQDKTIVMPPGMGEIHSQIEIAFNQIKSLNKRLAAVEEDIEDRNQKQIKLAEHVIVLEKEMAQAKVAMGDKKPPIMPL
ncbi:MAG: hypothetical protein ACKVQC_00765 [Elusimicrobiota bacterium]